MKFCEEYYLAMAEADRWADELSAVEATKDLESSAGSRKETKPAAAGAGRADRALAGV